MVWQFQDVANGNQSFRTDCFRTRLYAVLIIYSHRLSTSLISNQRFVVKCSEAILVFCAVKRFHEVRTLMYFRTIWGWKQYFYTWPCLHRTIPVNSLAQRLFPSLHILFCRDNNPFWIFAVFAKKSIRFSVFLQTGDNSPYLTCIFLIFCIPNSI